MADFGKAGKVTVRTDRVSTSVNLTGGEFLSYKVSVQGPVPDFTFSCSHRSRFSASELPGHPKDVYEWDWKQDDKDGDDDEYGLLMSFTGATKYTLVVQVRSSSGAVRKTVKDVDYESSEPKDSFLASLLVLNV